MCVCVCLQKGNMIEVQICFLYFCIFLYFFTLSTIRVNFAFFSLLFFLIFHVHGKLFFFFFFLFCGSIKSRNFFFASLFRYFSSFFTDWDLIFLFFSGKYKTFLIFWSIWPIFLLLFWNFFPRKREDKIGITFFCSLYFLIAPKTTLQYFSYFLLFSTEISSFFWTFCCIFYFFFCTKCERDDE